MKGGRIREIALLKARRFVLKVLPNEFNLFCVLRILYDDAQNTAGLCHLENVRCPAEGKRHYMVSFVMDVRLASLG
jgi:hypothetical protein